MVYTQDGYIMLLDALYFDDVKVGNVSQDGIDWSGDSAEYINLYAAQVRSAPVKKVKKKGATNVLSFTLIELLAANCAAVMGGTANGEKWDAPEDDVYLEGPVKILAGTGQTIDIKKVVLDGAVRGQLGGDTPLGIDCEMEMVRPDGGGSPFSIYPTTPFIKAAPAVLSFSAAGESKIVEIEASGKFSASEVPEGFEMKVANGHITITASPNAGAARNGEITFTLASDATRKATVSLTQAGT